MPSELPLAEQRRQLREQLATQRATLAAQIAPGAQRTSYPRSITMRWLTRHPVLATALVRRVAGMRVAIAVPALLAVLALVRAWRVAPPAPSTRADPDRHLP